MRLICSGAIRFLTLKISVASSWSFLWWMLTHLSLTNNSSKLKFVLLLKANFKTLTQPTQTSLRCLQDVLKRSRCITTKQDIVTTSGKRCQIYDVLKTSDLWRLPNVWLTTSWRRLIYVVLKTSYLQRLESVWFTTSSGCMIYNVLKTSNLQRLEDVWFMTSWRRL